MNARRALDVPKGRQAALIAAVNQAISVGQIGLHVEIAFDSATATWPATSLTSNN